MSCQELFSRDIVAIDFYKMKDCTVAIPFNVPNIQSLSGVTLGTSQMHIAMTGAQIAIDTAATLKISRARKAAGFIYQHDIDCNISEGISTCEAKIAALGAEDLLVVTENGNGDKFIHYACPGTCSLNVDHSIGESSDTGALKLSLSSMSGMIVLLP